MFVSAGEITLADLAQTTGKQLRGGAEVRLLNIDADAGANMGIFEDIHGAESAGDFARHLKNGSASFYGTPLRAWLRFLIERRSEVEKAARNFQTDFVSKYVPQAASREVFRAAYRFALIALAGELASEAEITGWRQDEATNAAAVCLRSWINHRGTAGGVDAEAAIRQVRRFLEANGNSRFQNINGTDTQPVVGERAGFRRQKSDGPEFLILQEIFKSEVCSGYDYRQVRKVLEERGYLAREVPHWTVKPGQLPGMPLNARVYRIRAAILEDPE